MCRGLTIVYTKYNAGSTIKLMTATTKCYMYCSCSFSECKYVTHFFIKKTFY